MLYCKKNNLAPICTRPKFAVRVSNYLRNKISHKVLETQTLSQHVKKKKLTRQLKDKINHINNEIGFICKIVFYSRIKNIVSKEKCRLDKIHNKKLDKLFSESICISQPKYRIAKNIINNFSSYTLTSEEEYALWLSLNQRIPTKNNTSKVKTNFESYFYHIQKYTKDLDQELQDELKNKDKKNMYQKYINYNSNDKDWKNLRSDQ